MTEAAWLTATDPTPMLDFLSDRTSYRKLRLFAVACCRRCWDLLDDRSRGALEVAAERADGKASAEQVEAAVDAAVDGHCVLDAEYYNNPFMPRGCVRADP